MTSKRRPYKTYPKEFKLEAVRMMESSDKPAADVARELGLRRNQLYKWKEQLEKTGDVSSGKRGRPKKSELSDTAKLEAEVRRLKEENEILKKAAVFFAKELD
ncbi:transposase [Aestuariirhabdus sp. Z084]|uniref:transposase n=1 Tax=Aestuariirhabdus haliotis TaxID=2918751 RepID=UPI00201B39A3|nr:transposase [Aestuariirhabdus haliotis]MCL6417873.1 transposase [Aestuariirhabdus haliotis]MCL6420995.1 transposase [Aestuariirhabdus haliotis]